MINYPEHAPIIKEGFVTGFILGKVLSPPPMTKKTALGAITSIVLDIRKDKKKFEEKRNFFIKQKKLCNTIECEEKINKKIKDLESTYKNVLTYAAKLHML